MDTKQPEALRIADDLHHSITHYGAEDAFTFSAYEAEQCVRALHAENETLRTGYDAARLEIDGLQKAATDRHALQAAGAHPAPCARYCEAQAFRIELRNLHAENERLRASYDAALDEIASLQARAQELGKAARDVNSRRVIELEAQLAAVGAGGVEPLRKRECLHKISEPAQPVAWAIFAENGNCRMWTQSRQNAEATAKDIGLLLTPLYAAPQSAALAQSAAPRNAPLYDPDDVAFSACHNAEGGDVPPELSSIAAEEVAAAEVTAPSGAGEYPPLVCDYCGALTPDPWHSSGMLCGKMSKHIHSCDACAARGAAQAAKKGGQHGTE